MQYYTVKDIVKITGYSEGKSYELIRKINKKYKRKYPESIEIKGKVPTWFYDELMGTGFLGKVEPRKEI